VNLLKQYGLPYIKTKSVVDCVLEFKGEVVMVLWLFTGKWS